MYLCAAECDPGRCGRYEMKNLGAGRHQLIIKNAQLSDEGDYICKSDRVETKGHLTVNKGESKPKIKFEGPVTGEKG